MKSVSDLDMRACMIPLFREFYGAPVPPDDSGPRPAWRSPPPSEKRSAQFTRGIFSLTRGRIAVVAERAEANRRAD